MNIAEEMKKMPEDVVNPKAYQKWLILSKHPILRNLEYVASDGTEINLGMLPHMLQKRIEHLPPKEQEDILEMKRQYNVMRGKLMSAKAQAFGRTAGYHNEAGTEGGAKLKKSAFAEDIVELLGRMFTIGEVMQIMGVDNGIEITEDEVRQIMRKHLPEIERKREEFRNKVADVRLYNKRPRLEELAWMYGKMKMKFVTLNGIESYNAMLRTLEQIRKEAEGDIISINGAIDINIEASIQAHIQKEIYKTINLKEVILGRIAARMNYDPVKLIAGLHNSYYAKFVELSGDEYDPNAEMQYPSNSPYDFAAIERTADKATMDVTPVPIEEKERSTAANVKAMFLEKIRKQKADIENRMGVAQMAAVRRDEMRDMDDYSPVKNRGTGRGKDKIPPSRTGNGKKLLKNQKEGYKEERSRGTSFASQMKKKE